MRNPFADQRSPILEIYKRSRSKSQQSKELKRHLSSPFRQFQVKMIQNALQHNHIISKEYRGQQKKERNRQKMQSKYYGVESQRYGCPSKIEYEPDQVPAKSYYFMKQNEPTKSVKFEKRSSSNSSNMDTMVHLGYQRSGRDSLKKMSYQSHLDINPQTSESAFSSMLKVPSMKNAGNNSKNSRLGERKCSITSSLDDYENSRSSENIKTPSKFGEVKGRKDMLDRIREEYFLEASQSNAHKTSRSHLFY